MNSIKTQELINKVAYDYDIPACIAEVVIDKADDELSQDFLTIPDVIKERLNENEEIYSFIANTYIEQVADDVIEDELEQAKEEYELNRAESYLAEMAHYAI